MTDAAPHSRGHLNPGAAGVHFDRFELGPGLSQLVRHVWLVTWDLPGGVVSEQRVLSYPAVNIVFEPAGAALYGPDSRVDTRRLSGSSWALGILFRPAAATLLTETEPRELVRIAPAGEPSEGAPMVAVRECLIGAVGGEARPAALGDHERSRLVSILRNWLAPLAAGTDEGGVMLNRVCEVAENDDSIVRVDELAASVGVSVRTLERLLRSRLGVSPKWLIECRRMQNAATQLFASSETDLTGLAIDLGFVDYAHFSHRYSNILHETPERTRRAGERARVESAGR